MSQVPTWQGETQSQTRGRRGWDGERDLRVPGLTILYHPDLDRIGERVALPRLQSRLSSDLAEVSLSRLEPAFAPVGSGAVRPLADPRISRSPLRLRAVAEGIELDLSACRTQVELDEQLTVSQDGELPRDGSLDGQSEVIVLEHERIEQGVVLLLASSVVLLLHRLDPTTATPAPRYDLVGDSLGMRQVREDIQRLADLEVPVLLRGETGTGKELVAQALHRVGPRREQPFVAVDMASLPPTLAVAELFGAERGAFSGADRRRVGYFRQARRGTLFLDEIGETPDEVQAMLLRTLETGQVQPLGGGEPFQAELRLLAATDADLEAAVATQRFKAPLLHRLQGFEIHIPPLRQRRDDFGRLLRHFLRLELRAIGETHKLEATPGGSPWLPARLVARLACCRWPGNVRQLRNVVRQLVIGGRGESRLRPSSRIDDLVQQIDAPLSVASASAVMPTPASSTSAGRGEEPASGSEEPRSRRPSNLRQEEVKAALREQRWRIQDAARQLGISRPSLYDLMKQIPGLRKASELERGEIEACQQRCAGNLDAMVDELEVSKQGLKRRMKQLGIDLELPSLTPPTPPTSTSD